MDKFWKNLASLQEKCKNLGYVMRTAPQQKEDIIAIIGTMYDHLWEMRHAVHHERESRESTELGS